MLICVYKGTIKIKQNLINELTQSAITFSKLTIEIVEQGVKYVQS